MILEQKGIQKKYFSCFSMKTNVVDTYKKHLTEALLMCSKTYFCGEKRKKNQYLLVNESHLYVDVIKKIV